MIMLYRAAFCLSIFLLSFDHVITTNTTELDRVAIDEQWSHWKRVHNKQYTNNEEHNRRRDLWIRNLITVMQQPLEMHDFGFVTLLRYHVPQYQIEEVSRPKYEHSFCHALLPSNTHTHTHTQGDCGSCWAFSTTGALEGQYSKKYGKQLEFSEQQLVDCSGSYGNHGCHGGSMELAFRYLKKYGLEEEHAYPYQAREQSCQFDEGKAVVSVKSYSTVHSGNERTLRQMVANHGPVSVAVDADEGFQNYRSGIYESRGCSSRQLNHGMLVVGYGLEGSSAYWIIKNSWGSRWGEEGYIRLARDRDNMCGVASSASVPEIK
ncbi:Secreted cathepsin L 2 [Fasciola gigantica]|uniref:Secreted cathepsin L 2 n=1 Tax=Fasciola gigantica TaxID=46835 RepID=A0A504YKW2_FASGI|nr:Secreted cathepsin L 2 [Fasciola gigantica]